MKTVKLNKETLAKYIKSVIKENLHSDDVAQPGLWDDPDPDDIPYQYVLEDLINAAMAAVTPVITKKLDEAGAFRSYPRSDKPGGTRMDAPGMTLNDVQLEIEEPLLDALRPIAKIVYQYGEKVNPVADDDW